MWHRHVCQKMCMFTQVTLKPSSNNQYTRTFGNGLCFNPPLPIAPTKQTNNQSTLMDRQTTLVYQGQVLSSYP